MSCRTTGPLPIMIEGTRMTEQEAYRVLGLPNDAGAELIRKKYRELIVQVHPDTLLQLDAGAGGRGDSSSSFGRHQSGRSPLFDARKINQAYHVLQRLHNKSMLSQEPAQVQNRNTGQRTMNPAGTAHSQEPGTESYGKWNAPCNPHAYMAREVYCRAEDVDGTPIGVFPIARGNYLWTLDEDFPLFMKSIYLCAGQLLNRADAEAPSAQSIPDDDTDILSSRSVPGSGADASSGRAAGQRGASSSRSRREQALISLTFLLAQQFIDAQSMLRALAVRMDASGEVRAGGCGGTDNHGSTEEPSGRADTGTWSLPAMLEINGGSSSRGKELQANGSRVSSSLGKKLPAEGEYIFPAGIRDHRLYLKNASGQELGYLSFRDDRMYYIMIPLFEQRRVQVRIRVTGAPASKKSRSRRTRSSAASGFSASSTASVSSGSAWQDLELQVRFKPMQGNLFPESINAQIDEVLREYRSG